MGNALRTQEFGERYARVDVVDIAESVIQALWHLRWWDPLIEGETDILIDDVMALYERLKFYDISARRDFAKEMLSRWDQISDVVWATKEKTDEEEAERLEASAKE